MGCFGFSRKVPKKNLKLSHDHMDIDMVKTGSLRKKSRWISWSKFHMKKSTARKTVPVDASVSKKFNGSSKIQSFKLDKKVSSKKYRWSTGVNPSKIPAAVPDQAINNKAHKKKRSMTANAIILESGEMDYSNSGAKDDTCQKPSSRKKEKKTRTGSSNPGLPPVKKYVQSNPTTTLPPHSADPPKKQKAINGGDPVIGMSIIMVSLVIMLVWGKICAILCTSAWFYMVPRLRKVVDSNDMEKMGSDSGGPDLNSEEHKKKVVLEGLLQRNHRRSAAGIL